MELIRRAYDPSADAATVFALAQMQPEAARHSIDLPWRLSSPACTTGRDVMVWEDDAGKLIGFAAWQRYWAALDVFIHPATDQAEVTAEIVAWAIPYFQTLDAERERPLPYWVEYRDDDAARQALYAAHGFTLDDDFRYAQLRHPLTDLPLPASLPESFTIRPLAGEREVPAYIALHRAAFDSESMTDDWRRRTLHMPTYRPDLDLVVTAPDGRLVGFCVGWFEPVRRLAQIEPLGVHPDYQGHGLGRALLGEIVRRFAAAGATAAYVETESDRDPALQAYQAVGFAPAHTIIRTGRWVTPHA